MSAIEAWLDSLSPKARERCWWCNKRFSIDWNDHGHVHHIERRNWARRDRVDQPCNLFLVCIECHQTALEPSNRELHARQLAAKLLRDPAHFDLTEWLRIRDPVLKASERVTLADIVQYLELVGFSQKGAA